MGLFKFQAYNAKTKDPIKAEIFLGGKSRGWTFKSKDKYLEVETAYSGNYDWYAEYSGKKFDSGKSGGGTIKALYEPEQ